jgi:hypothetical protein
MLPATTAAQTVAQREDRIKAALVFKVIKFVDWPAAVLPDREPLQICALGTSPVGEALSAADGKAARDRFARFRRIDGLSAAETKGCHVLYLPGGARDNTSGLPALVRERGILTVSDRPDFARRGGMIGLIRAENRISFEINLRNAREGGIEPGAPLLELANIID